MADMKYASDSFSSSFLELFWGKNSGVLAGKRPPACATPMAGDALPGLSDLRCPLWPPPAATPRVPASVGLFYLSLKSVSTVGGRSPGRVVLSAST